jgi:small-conductance mechanosensitive channel
VILAGDQPIMQVVDADVSLEGLNRQVLAQVLQLRIGEAIDRFRHDRQPALLLRHALYALAATVVFLIVMYSGRQALRRAYRYLETRCENRFRRGVAIQSFRIIHSDQLWRILTASENLFGAIVLISAVYLYLDFVLSLFPWTRWLSRELFSLLVNPLHTMGRGLLRQIPDLTFLLILGIVIRYVLILTRLFFDAIESRSITLRNFEPAWAEPTYRLVRVGMIAFAVVVAYPYIPGSNSDAFKGVTLFIGVLFSLGSSSLIGNILAGYTLTYRRTFKVGDRVKIGEHLGDVEQCRVMATYLRTPKNEMIVVPNSRVVAEDVINYSTLAKTDGLILHTNIGIGYDVPWRQVEAMLLQAAARTPEVLREPQPFVLQKTLGDFAVTYELNGYCNQPNIMGRVYTRLHQNILDLFNEYGVQIMTPAYESDPDQQKIVTPDRWYASPARKAS